MTKTTNPLPLVSIIIPVYNGENYLRQAIDSAIAQSYKPIEILVINDGSSDWTEEIALSYGDKIIYHSKENGGVSTALNLGIKKMKGEYFSWLSHDDLYRKDKIEKQVKAIGATLNAIVYSDFVVIDKAGNALAEMNIAKTYPKLDLTFGLSPLLRQAISGCTLLIHRSHFNRVGLFKENLRATQDYDLWFRMFRGQQLIYINEALQYSREHGSQVTHKYEKNRTESDKLWLHMLQNLTIDEIRHIGQTEENFWDGQVDFLQYTRYSEASTYAKLRLKELGSRAFAQVSFRRMAYVILSKISSITRYLGLQTVLKDSKFFKWGYRLWFGLRFK